MDYLKMESSLGLGLENMENENQKSKITTKTSSKSKSYIKNDKTKQEIENIKSQSSVEDLTASPKDESLDHIDDTLFQSKQEQSLDSWRLTMVPASMRSFNSAHLDKDERSGDYSREAEVGPSGRNVMDKIA